jgi:hypothetical protein
MVLLPNDLYDLEKETFRLYYTSLSEEQQTIDLYFIDNHGKVFTLSFSFNNEREEEYEMAVQQDVCGFAAFISG